MSASISDQMHEDEPPSEMPNEYSNITHKNNTIVENDYDQSLYNIAKKEMCATSKDKTYKHYADYDLSKHKQLLNKT